MLGTFKSLPAAPLPSRIIGADNRIALNPCSWRTWQFERSQTREVAKVARHLMEKNIELFLFRRVSFVKNVLGYSLTFGKLGHILEL